MPRARYMIPLRVFEVPHRNPETPQQAESNRHPVKMETHVVIEGSNVDGVLKAARDHLTAEGRGIRSLAMGKDEVVAVVFPAVAQAAASKVVRESARSYKGVR